MLVEVLTLTCRLVEFLYAVPRNRQELLPYYCRFIATLAQHMTVSPARSLFGCVSEHELLLQDIGTEIVGLLINEFWGRFKRKEQVWTDCQSRRSIHAERFVLQFHLESRLRNIRYLSELTKFKVAEDKGEIDLCCADLIWHHLIRTICGVV